MPTISELNDLTPEKAERTRKNLGVSQRFVCEALGVGASNWSGWVTKKDKGIPEKYHKDVIELFVALGHLKNGRRLLPVAKDNIRTDPQAELVKDAIEVVDVLWEGLKSNITNRIILRSHQSIVNELKNQLKSLLPW